MKRMKLLFTLVIPVLLSQGTNAQTGSRLTAEAHWSNNGAMFKQVDSIGYSYSSNTRGGDLTHTLKYDNSTTWNYINDSAYVNGMATIQTFDANNNITSITTEQWNDTTWVLSTKSLFTYNSSNMVTQKIQQTWNGTSWSPVSEDLYNYSPSGKLQSDEYLTWGLAGFTGVSEKIYSYDVTNTWLINETDENIGGGAPVYTTQTAYTYDSVDHRELTTTNSMWNGAAWVNTTMQTNAYDTAGHRITWLSQTYNVGTAAWDNTNFTLYSNFTAGNMPQKAINQVWNPIGSGSWDNSSMDVMTYNSYNQLTSSTRQSWNVVGVFEYQSGDPMSNYYYQVFTNAVKNVPAANGQVNVYPVPAQNMLHIDINWNVAQSATIAVYDLNGRMVSPVIDVPNGTEYRAGLSISNLANGMYLVKINGTNDQVVKEIVVAN